MTDTFALPFMAVFVTQAFTPVITLVVLYVMNVESPSTPMVLSVVSRTEQNSAARGGASLRTTSCMARHAHACHATPWCAVRRCGLHYFKARASGRGYV